MVSRRSDSRKAWAFRVLMAMALLLLLATVPGMADQAKGDEKLKCDLVGEEQTESEAEKALLQKLSPLTSLSFETKDKDGKYIFKFKLCSAAGNDSNGGLVQLEVKTNKETVLGRFNETHIFNGSDWIMLIYKEGDPYGSHCNNEKRTAMVMISCYANTLGKNFVYIGEERMKEKNCFYLFEMDSSVACPPVERHLSLGSILLIVFSTLVAVYIIGGFLYQRLVVGAKGMEQFPNYSFWQDFGNLTADGCDFVCRSRPRNEPAAYRGVGDDQLGEETEERDDHLLPM